MDENHVPVVKSPAARRPSTRDTAWQFLVVFLGTVLLGFAALAAGHVVLKHKGLLPAPPVTATSCIDDKLAAMRRLSLDDRTVVAVGSSTTWRNLDMAVFERHFAGTRAYNAATCYLHVDQTAYFAEFILRRAPRVETVVVVVAPRDFEACPPDSTAVFDPHLAHAYLSGTVPRWLPYLTGFRPLYLAREARMLRQASAESEAGFRTQADRPRDDAHGSSVLVRPHGWRPPPHIDRRCYAGLASLENAVAARGAKLVVATLPVMPEWAAAFDPDGGLVEDWTRTVADTLRSPTSLLVDGRVLPWDDSRFADPVHVIFPNHRPFTEFIADAVAERWPVTTADH